MNRIETIEAEFVETIPAGIQAGKLYVSRKYRTATHLCCCGCGSKVVTPLKPGGWTLRNGNSDQVTLWPSIGNWSFPCKSHYWIRAGQVVWAPTLTEREIDAVRRGDQLAREEHFDARQEKEPWWRRIMRRLFG